MSQRRLFDMLLLSCSVLPAPVDLSPVVQELVRRFHRHTTEIGNKMGAMGMTCDITFRAFSSILPAKRQHITTVTTPVCSQVRERFETVRNSVIDLFLVSILKKHNVGFVKFVKEWT